MKFDILNRLTGKIQFTAEIACDDGAPRSIKLGLAVKWARSNGANLCEADLCEAGLYGADLYGADLRGADLCVADLRGANLRGADLRGAYLYGADLRGADLRRANLRGADLCVADLRGANLRGADLRGAYLYGADLRGADLRGAYLYGADLREADLRGADLRGADLYGADLREADLRGADLRGAKNIPAIAAAQTCITPDGSLIGWKKCNDGVIVKLSIPAEARRSNATGRKCRAEFVDVLGVIGSDVGVSQHDGKTKYRAGERVTCDKWCENRWEECAGGIHFFLTLEEAEAY